jgi:hypothetical protein
VARRCLRRDGGGKIEGLPLLWVGLGGKREGPHTGLCIPEAHGVAHDGGQMGKQAAKAQGGRAIGEAPGLSLCERGGGSLGRGTIANPLNALFPIPFWLSFYLSPAKPRLTEAKTLNPLIFMVKCANKGRKTRDEPAKI